LQVDQRELPVRHTRGTAGGAARKACLTGVTVVAARTRASGNCQKTTLALESVLKRTRYHGQIVLISARTRRLSKAELIKVMNDLTGCDSVFWF